MKTEKGTLLLLLVSVMPVSAQTYVGEVGAGDSSIPLHLSSPPSRSVKKPSGDRVRGTVVVASALSDGLVLAADSRMTLTTANVSPGYKIVSDSTNKIYDVGSCAIATYGEAFILGRDVGSYIQDFGLQIAKAPVRDVQELATKLAEYFGPFYGKEVERRKSIIEIGFVVVGYGNDGIGKILEVRFPGPGKPVELHNTRDNVGMVWRGQTDVINRIIKGVDPLIVSLPSWSKLNPQDQASLGNETARLEYNIPYQYLMLQDGVDLSLFLVQATVDVQRFSFGTAGWPGAIPGVGGPVDVVTVTPFKLEWIRRKALTSR